MAGIQHPLDEVTFWEALAAGGAGGTAVARAAAELLEALSPMRDAWNLLGTQLK